MASATLRVIPAFVTLPTYPREPVRSSSHRPATDSSNNPPRGRRRKPHQPPRPKSDPPPPSPRPPPSNPRQTPATAEFSRKERRQRAALLRRRSSARKLQNKVKAVLLDEEDFPGRQPDELRRPLKVNVDLAAYHAREAAKRGEEHVPRALELYERCVRLDPMDGRGWLGLARIKFSQGSVDEARRTFATGVKYCKQNAHLLQAWGVMEEKLGNYNRARGLLVAATKANDAHAPSWVALGCLEQKRERNLERAKECLLNAVQAGPRNYYAWHTLAMLEWEMGDTESARKHFQQGVEVNPTNAATLHAWGTMEHALQNRQKAGELYRRAHRAYRKNTRVLLSWALLEDQSNQPKSARALLLQGLRANPRDGALYQALGLMEYRRLEIGEARRLFREGTEMAPRHCPTWQAWGILEARQGRPDLARNLFQQGIWSNPKSPDVVSIWHAWGYLEASLGMIEAARKLFNYGLRVDKNSSYILLALAKLESAAPDGSYSAAQSYFERAVEAAPLSTLCWDSYEEFEMSLGNADAAANIRQRALMMRSNSNDPRLTVSGPQAGDFTSQGPWISEEDLRPKPSPSGGTLWKAPPQQQSNLPAQGFEFRVESWLPRPQPQVPPFNPNTGSPPGPGFFPL